MDIQTLLFTFFGGLALFLFGMNFMSDGLKNIGSNTFRKILKSLTKNRIRAILVGAGITCLIQSSSATSVMVVGFVNASLLVLKQAVAVVLGADIGTTFTAWMVSIMGKFKISHYSLPIIAIGFLIYFIGRKRKTKMVGQSILGFGLLFLGLGIMSDGLKPLKDSVYVIELFAKFGRQPFLGILVGMLVTMILQSSSVTIAIVQVMAFQGIIGFDAALPLLLGDNIGTTITAQLAAIGGTKNSRGVAMANSMFKIFGVIIFIPFLISGLYESFVKLIVPGVIQPSNIMVHIAVAHSIFNIVNVLIFSTVLWKVLIKVAEFLSFGKQDGMDRETKYLDPLLLTDPPIAMQQTIFELVRMTKIAKTAVEDAEKAFINQDTKMIRPIMEKEDVLNDLQRSITSYLIQISEKDLGTRESMEYPILLHSINDIEKIGDYAKNLANYVEICLSRKLKFSKQGLSRIKAMFKTLYSLFDNVIYSLKAKDSRKAYKAIDIEDRIDEMKKECRANYIQNLHKRNTDPEAAMMIMDVASNIEKMGDHLISISKAVLKDLQWGKKINTQNFIK